MTDRPFFSIIIPAHNEEGCIATTCRAITNFFDQKPVRDYEIVVVNDGSRDRTEQILQELSTSMLCVRYVNNQPPNGFGFAIRKGLESFKGDCACIVMGDLSDAPEDVYTYYQHMKQGAECVFGSRFIKGSQVIDYPKHKLYINRLANWFIKMLFRLDHNDITNAFKCYRREVIEAVSPLLSAHFNLTVELPLKAIIRGYRYVTVPISWRNRDYGVSKLKIKEMGSRYLFIVLYCWLERKLARGDYHRDRRK